MVELTKKEEKKLESEEIDRLQEEALKDVKKYKLKCWIDTGDEGLENQEPQSSEDIQKELEQAELMFPENRYEIVEVDNKGKVSE